MQKIARVLTESFSPPIITGLYLLIVGIVSGQWWLGVYAALVAAGIPMLMLAFAIRKGKVTDRHVSDHRQRLPILLFTLATVALAALLVWVTGSKLPLLLALLFLAIGVVVTAAVNIFWKLSAHAAMASFVGLSIATFAWPVGVIALLIPIGVCWSRVKLGDHTVLQVIAGAGLGLIIGWGFFGVLASV